MYAPAEMEQPEGMMVQYAPYPEELEDLVKSLRYREGWSFDLRHIERDHADTHGGGAGGLTFIGITGDFDGPDGAYRGATDAYHPNRPRPVYFYFPVPAATYNRASWQRWLFDCLSKVELHEQMEHFAITEEVWFGGGFVEYGLERRPFAPTHGPGDDPYIVHEFIDGDRRHVSFDGKVRSG